MKRASVCTPSNWFTMHLRLNISPRNSQSLLTFQSMFMTADSSISDASQIEYGNSSLADSWSYAHACMLHVYLYSHETGKCVHIFKLIFSKYPTCYHLLNKLFWTFQAPRAFLFTGNVSFMKQACPNIQIHFWSIHLLWSYANARTLYANSFLLC